MAGKRAVRLKSLGDVHRFLAKTINQLHRGDIEESRAAKLGYLCNILIGVIKDSDLEARIRILEEFREREQSN